MVPGAADLAVLERDRQRRIRAVVANVQGWFHQHVGRRDALADEFRRRGGGERSDQPGDGRCRGIGQGLGQALLAGLNIVTFPTPQAPRFKVCVAPCRFYQWLLIVSAVRLVVGHGK